jgi:hypothetical protein
MTSTDSLLRRGLLALATLTMLGIAVELAIERHWTQPIQLVAWGAVGVLAVAIILLAWQPSATRVRVAQVLALLVIGSAALGIGEHVYANHDSGSLDQRYGQTWDTLPEPTQWWLAISKTVGPAPPFAPGALAEAGLAVLLASARHPARVGSGLLKG